MYEKKGCDDNFTNGKPWIQYPQLEEIKMKIPFYYESAEEKFTHIVNSVHDTWDITTDLQTGWREHIKYVTMTLSSLNPIPDLIS